MELWQENDNNDLVSLQEMSLLVNIDKLECLFNFITHTINLMEEHNDKFGDDITQIL